MAFFSDICNRKRIFLPVKKLLDLFLTSSIIGCFKFDLIIYTSVFVTCMFDCCLRLLAAILEIIKTFDFQKRSIFFYIRTF